MTLQQIARRNFNLYYIQENLIELKAKQIAENKLMDEAEEFAEVNRKDTKAHDPLHISMISFAGHCLLSGNPKLSMNSIKN